MRLTGSEIDSEKVFLLTFRFGRPELFSILKVYGEHGIGRRV